MKWGRRPDQPHSGSIPEAADPGRPTPPSAFRPPEPFADRYTGLQLLGRGGFGDVYRAWDTQMERPVALKLLKRDLALDADWRRRFRQEATRNLLHQNITINFDIGDYQEQPFIVMELVEGDPLSRIIERRIPLTDVERLSLIEQLCDGLHYAHTQQVIHRDIKPANLMVCEKPQGDRVVRTLKILDFGISKVVSTEDTSTGSFMFSPPYVSPEQVRGEPADERSDLFAVGTVAYELLSYQKAFDIQSKGLFEILNEVRRKNAEEPHRPLLEIRPDIDPQLSAIIDRALAKHPAERFGNLAEMGRQLRKVRERLEDQLGGDSTPTLVLSPTVQTTVREARQALEAGDPTAALGKLEHALATQLSRAERRLLEEISADARERHYQKSGARLQNDRAAVAEAIQWARMTFANGQRTAAIERLEHFEPAELVLDDLDTLRATKAALAQAEHAVRAGGLAEGREAIARLERSCPPDLIAADAARLRQLVDARPSAHDDRNGSDPGGNRRVLVRASILMVATGMVAFGAYQWWPSSETPSDSRAVVTSVPVDPSGDARQQIGALWSQDRHGDAVKELEKAITRWPQDPELVTLRARFVEEAKAASERARRQAESAGAASAQLFKVATAAAAQAQTHAMEGRPVESIHAYLEAVHNYTRAFENPGRHDALKLAETAHQALARQKSFDQNAPDYRTAREAYEAAKSRAEPASVGVLRDLPARFKAVGEKMSEAAALQARGLQQARAGQHQEALTTLRDARTRFPGYRATRQLGKEVRESAGELAQQRRQAAASAGANAKTSVTFAEGLQTEQQASQATSDEAAIEFFREAIRFYGVAEKESRRTPPAVPDGKGGNPDRPSTPTPSPDRDKPPIPSPPPAEVKPPAPTTPPGGRDRAAEEGQITATIEQYKRGYREMNPGIIRSVYPTFSKERQSALESSANDCKAYPVEFLEQMKIDFFEGAERASVTARARYGCEPKRGGRINYFPPETEFFSLQKENGRWIIKDMPGR